MSTVDLRYSGTAALTVNLPHDEVCCRAGRCLCNRGRWASVYLLPGIWQRGLSDAVLHSRELAGLIAAGTLRVRTVPDKRSAVAEKTLEPSAPRPRRRASKE